VSVPDGGPTARAVDRVVDAIDTISTLAGWLAGWLIVPMTLAVTYEVIARYAFGAPTRWSYDAGWILYGAQFMLAAAYTLRVGGHIRTDVLYERWSPRTRASVDAVCYVLFFFPGMVCILYAGFVEARAAWEISERTGLRLLGISVPMYVVKGVIPASSALLLLQGVSELIRAVRTIRGRTR
jgi:TRAP-type mannitol/chloroaromatic compound transport system permease small subunit